MIIRFALVAFGLAPLLYLWADGPQDNLPDKVRRVPPPGVTIPASDRSDLEAGVLELAKEIEGLDVVLKGNPALVELLPDVEIYHKAVMWALIYDEFYNVKEVTIARNLLKQGLERAKALREGKAPWTSATGLVVRGYVSKIDGSVQPYGLVVPASYEPGTLKKSRLDIWCHGRVETLTELNFIDARQKSPGEFTPPDAFVLHLYGRYCNANKFAGEIDCFEALGNVRRHYPIDESRLVMRGFSMGGAACWQFAVHYPSAWCAAAPGAGFSETADFLKVFQNEAVKPTWYEQKLWHLYDCTDYAVNLFNCPTVAYSGEIDKQKQAADMMEKAMAAEGLKLTHIIGPQTAHKYHPQAKEEINRLVDGFAVKGRDSLPKKVRFTTWTLRYNQSHWVTIDALEKHWERARVDAELGEGNTMVVNTTNVAGLTLTFPIDPNATNPVTPPKIHIDGQVVSAVEVAHAPTTYRLQKDAGKWRNASGREDSVVRKRHGLQGPIDDGFMDSFVMVKPTGQPLNTKVAAWTTAEMNHAIEHWRRQFRGEAPVKNDNEITEADWSNKNLVLWGDPSSNKVLAKIADRLPIRWTAEGIQAGNHTYSADHHMPVFIYPNPLNPKRYVVLNSGFTFREYDYLSNARQVPKLPDYAIVDIDVPVTARLPGGIADAGFFGEKWEWLEGSGR